MTIRLSAGLRTALVTNYGMGAMLQYGHIRVYSGLQPDSASLAPTGTLLAIISDNGTTPQPSTTTGGLQLVGSTEVGTLVKAGRWVLNGRAAGTAGWWRFVGNGFDDDTPSNYFPRMDGAVGDSLVLGFNDIAVATSAVIASFTLVLPPQ